MQHWGFVRSGVWVTPPGQRPLQAAKHSGLDQKEVSGKGGRNSDAPIFQLYRPIFLMDLNLKKSPYRFKMKIYKRYNSSSHNKMPFTEQKSLV
jgi:hypothetical protein